MKQRQEERSRRSFLKYVLASSCGCFVSRQVFADSQMQGDDTRRESNSLLADPAMLLKDFQDTNEGALEYLTQAYDSDIARGITEQAETRFEALLALVPDLGGARNIVIHDFPVALWCVAYLKPMRAYGKTAEELGKMIYDLFETELQQIPEATRRLQGSKLFTMEHIDTLREWAHWTEKREYPANWVVTFVPGDGVDFDYGYDYSECAIVKYLKAHDADEAAPYICLNDFTRSRAYGTGLRRTRTLAEGDHVCDFRYKKGRPVTQDWSTEIPRIKARLKARSSGS